jgi:hypothetical protein
MSGYIERLVMGERAGLTRIAPLVRPLFLAQSVDPESAGSSLDRFDDEGPDGVADQATRTSDEAAEPRRTPQLQQSPRAASSLISFEPLFPKVVAPDELVQAAADDDDRSSLVRAKTTQPAPLKRTEVRPGAHQASVRRSGELRLRSALSEPRPQTSTTSAPSGGRTSVVDAPTRLSVGPTRAFDAGGPRLPTPDEIQIHIGRVEVVAVAPAAPQAVAQRERKSLRLENYLRNGC